VQAIITLFPAPWATAAASLALILGGIAIWRGLCGERGDRGLLLPDIGMRERIEGFRLLVFGLVLLGTGAAVLWRQEWLLVLALGIGFVEILESSALIAFWNTGEGSWKTKTASVRDGKTARRPDGRTDGRGDAGIARLR
jgi:hypothetical protein